MRLAGKASVPAVGPFVSFWAIVPIVFFPAITAAHNVSRFRVVLGAEYSSQYDSDVAQASNATAGPPAPPPLPSPLVVVVVVVTTAYVSKNQNSAVCGHDLA